MQVVTVGVLPTGAVKAPACAVRGRRYGAGEETCV